MVGFVAENVIAGSSKVTRDGLVRHIHTARSICLGLLQQKDSKAFAHAHKDDLLQDPHDIGKATDSRFQRVVLHLEISIADVAKGGGTDVIAVTLLLGVHIHVKGHALQNARSREHTNISGRKAIEGDLLAVCRKNIEAKSARTHNEKPRTAHIVVYGLGAVNVLFRSKNHLADFVQNEITTLVRCFANSQSTI